MTVRDLQPATQQHSCSGIEYQPVFFFGDPGPAGQGRQGPRYVAVATALERARGKGHKLYEFGVKVSWATPLRRTSAQDREGD